VLLACKSGGDAWLDRHLITKIFSRHGKVLDVFLPFGRKVLAVALYCVVPSAFRAGGWLHFGEQSLMLPLCPTVIPPAAEAHTRHRRRWFDSFVRGVLVQMAFVSFQDGEVLEQVLCIQQMNIENCQVTLTRAKKKEDGGVNLNARDLIAESSSASHTPRVYDSGPSQAPHTPRDARSPPRGWDNGSTLGKRDRVGEGGDPGRNDPLPSSSDNWPRPVCGVGMTLLEATRESNGCCVVSDIKRGGPADLSGRVRVGDHLVRAGGNNCVGIKREVIKTFVVGPSGSVVELEFARGQESIVVQLKRFAPPKQNEDTQLASLPPPGSAHADDWHKRPRFDSHMQAPAVEMPPPRESTAVQRDPRYDRGDLRATNFPPARSYHDGGSALDGRDGRPMGSFRDGGREGARGPPRDMYDQRADAKFPVRDEREQLQAGSGGGMGPRDMRRPERDDRTHDSRDAYPRGNEGNFRQDNQRSAMQGPPRGRSRSRSPPRGYHDERGPPPAGGYDNRRNNDERGAPPSGGYNKRSPPPIDRNRLQENRVFMTAIGGGLGWLNKDAIKYAMMQHGKVLQVFIPHGKKFAYVSFESGAAMEDVIRKRDFEFEGCKVRVDVAKPQGETKEGETSAPSFFHGGRPAPSFGQDRPHGRDTGLGNGFPAERNGRESRQYSGGGRDNHDFRDQSRLSSCAEDPHDSNPGNFPNPGIRNSVRSLSPPFSHCQSLESSVADRWSRSESLNFAAGNFRETRQGVSQDKSARAHQPTALDQDDISRLHVSQGHRSVGEKRRVVGVLNARPDPALAALQAARVMRSSVTYQSNDRSDRLLDREYETAGREAKNGEASRLHAMTPLFNKDAGDSAFDRQAPGVLVGDDTRLIKHEISWSSPHAVLDWLDKTSLDSVSLEKLLEAIGRCGDLLLPSAIDYPSHLPRIREESSAAQPLQVLQQCVRLVPAVGHRFLSNSSSSRGASAAAHRTTHRQATHETKDTPNFGKSAHLQSNVCPYFVVGRCNWGLDCRFEHALPADSCVRDSVSRGGNEVGSTAHHKADGRVPAVVNGRLVCTAVAGVARIYSRALHHYFADRTHVLARDVCAQCRNALSAMCCSAASHLEAEISREAHNGLNGRVDPCTGDAIEAMRVIAMLANDVADAAHGTRVDCDVSSTAVQQQLQQCMHAVGRWLVLLLAPSKRSSFRSAHAATSLTSQRTKECASDGVIDRASDNVRMPELARAPDDKSQLVAPLTIHDTVQVFSSFANVGCLPREELLSRLSLPLLTEGEQEMQVSEYCPQILDYVAALDASHVCLLITGVARLPCTENRMLVPLLKVLLEKATKKHVLEKMEMRQCVSLLTAFPYLAPKRQASLEEPPQQHNDSLPQALRLFRAVVEHLAEGMQDLDVPLDTPALARIARAHSRHWQGLDGIAGAMSLHLAKLAAIPTAVTGTSNACTAGASVQAQTEVGREGGKGGVEGALAAMTAEAGGADGGLGVAVGAPSSSKLVFTRLMDCADLLLGFSLVGSHEVPHSQGGARRTWALIEAALETCHRNTNVLERFTAAHVIVELLWSLSVAASSDNLRAGAGEGEGKTGNIEENARSRQGLREQLDALQARLLLLLARRYYARELSFAAGTQFVDADAASAGARARRARAEGLSDAASRASDGEATGAHEGPREELLGVHAEMVLQVVLVAPGGMLQDNRIQGLVKHVKEQGRQRDLARIERNTSMLDDMHQVPPLARHHAYANMRRLTWRLDAHGRCSSQSVRVCATASNLETAGVCCASCSRPKTMWLALTRPPTSTRRPPSQSRRRPARKWTLCAASAAGA